MWLLALLKAESGLNPHAERWGLETATAREWLANHQILQGIINRAWPDISFGYSQRIVLYHDFGDHTATVSNCLRVRTHVFENPDEDIRASASRLASGISRSLDKTPLGGMVVYNAGSDRRNDPAWMSRWAGNVASYERALEWAENYRN